MQQIYFKQHTQVKHSELLISGIFFNDIYIFITHFLFLILGESSTSKSSFLNATSGYSVIQHTLDVFTTEKSTIKTSLNTSYLIAGIGAIVLIIILITHLYQTFKVKKGKAIKTSTCDAHGESNNSEYV